MLLLSLFFSLSFYGQNDTISDVKTLDIRVGSVDTTNINYSGLKNANPISILNNRTSDVKKSNISVVSLDKMDVVYRGLPNPISIVVPNCKSFEASGNYLYKYAEGKYNLLPGSGTESMIILDITLNDGTNKKEVHRFRIKNVPKFSGTINGLSCEQCVIEMTKEELKTAIISADYHLSIYGIEFMDKVDSFRVEFSKNNSASVFDNKFDSKTLDIINKQKTGSIFTISDIHYPNPLNIDRTGPGIIKVMIVERKKSDEE